MNLSLQAIYGCLGQKFLIKFLINHFKQFMQNNDVNWIAEFVTILYKTDQYVW